MKQIAYTSCDVLIVGSGLAGLRAGISALSQSRDLTVCLATQGRGPSGSSFTNPNRALGLMVCHSSEEKDAFINTALDIAPPGMVFPELVSILAEESGFVYHDLVQTGLSFNRDNGRENIRYPACFLGEPPMAYVFGGLASAYLLLNKRFITQGGETWEGLSLLDLVTNSEGRVIGALFEELETGRMRAVRCQSLVMATGGAAGLFPRTLTDSGNIGVPLALMNRAGARMINMNYLQYIWYRHDPWEPWPCWTMERVDCELKADEKEAEVPESVRSLLDERRSHVPVAHGRKDSQVDRFLRDLAGSTGETRVRFSGGEWIRVGLYAHALNGGVLIDALARTGVPGLFACGECAGGMHGANRVGGAMVLASQVFGHRAGLTAARFAHDPDQESRRLFMDRVSHLESMALSDAVERKRGLDQLKGILRGSEGPFPRPGLDRRRKALCTMLEHAKDFRLKQALSCAVMMLT